MTGFRTTTILTSDHGQVTVLEPDWCTGHLEAPHHPRREEITHTGEQVDIEVHTPDGPRPLLNLTLTQDVFPGPAWPMGTAVHVVVGLLDNESPSYDLDGLDGLVTDLLEAAGRVRRVATLLASETRGGGTGE